MAEQAVAACRFTRLGEHLKTFARNARQDDYYDFQSSYMAIFPGIRWRF
jgi:hypothetical protein